MQDLSPAELISAIEMNLASWIPVFGLLGRAYLNDPPGEKRSITGLPFSLFNSVMDARLAADQTEAAIHAIVSDARARNVPVLWWIGPSSQPADLGKRLEDNGFVFDEDTPGMALDLERLNEGLPRLAGFSIQHAQDDAAWRQWSIVMETGFGASAPNELSINAWCSILRQAEPETVLAYTGYLEDKPVAASLLFLATGVAGVYCVATIPEARRKGIGALMTEYPLSESHSMGYRIGVLESSAMGLGVYRSLGFQEYCKFVTYVWKPEKASVG